MEQYEIKQRVDELMAEVKAAIAVNTFVLNPDIEEKMKEIKELQSTCTHEFDNGYCLYCYKADEEE